MKCSKLFGKTTKSIPADAKLVSHKLLFKGGFIRRFSTGRWGFLPLGMRVWEKIYKVIDEEMKAIGCQKLVVPTLHPIEIWQATNRDQAFGEEMLVVGDHHGVKFALGATAEGMMVELVKMFTPSYKDLPIEVYQFSQKFRDDKRPRGGIMRVREFMMKDAYNFCANEKQFMESYQKFYDAYLRIARKLNLKVTPVLADSGAIGGSLSHEFQVESPDGDQTYFVCDKCGYAANIEKAEFERIDLNPKEEVRPFKIIKQPKWVCTMEDNLKHYGQPLWRYLKNVVYKDEKGRIIIGSIRGDQSINEVKLRRAARAETLIPAEEKDLEKLDTKAGYVHSWGIKGAIFIGDFGLKSVKNFIGGQKEEETDSIDVNYDRDFKYEILADIVDAQNGDSCAKCKKGRLQMKHGFEWGHCFKIDHFYTLPQEGYYTDQKGVRQLLWMGSYGIGIERSIACLVEENHDRKGIIWPKSVAPSQAHLIEIEAQNKQVRKFAKEVYEQLQRAGIEVLFDDREEVSAGEKFADADLIGIPTRLVVSEKTLRQDSGQDRIEWKERTSKKTLILSLDKVISRLK
jgi:prolyl-tRNA synthetase